MSRIKHFIFFIAALISLLAATKAFAVSVAVSPDALSLTAGGSPMQLTIFNIEGREMNFFIKENSGAVSFSQENVLIPAKARAVVNATAKKSCAESSAEIEISPESQGEITPSLFVAAHILPGAGCGKEKHANPVAGFMLSAAIGCLGLIPYLKNRRINS